MFFGFQFSIFDLETHVKALLQIGFVRQCVPGRRLVFVATCALAFARYRADLSPSLSLSPPLSQSFNGRLALENQTDSEPKQSEPKTKSFPWLSPKCFRIIHWLRVFVVVVCFCCCLSTILCRRASHLCCATKSPPTYPILIKLSIKYLPLHLPFPFPLLFLLLRCLFLFCFLGFLFPPLTVCVCACVCVLGA